MQEVSARYCPTCLTLVDAASAQCGTCARGAPEGGWPETRPNRYPWLGEELDGRYKLVQYIGFGSTGEVYRAISSRVGRSFAAKVIDRRSLPRSIDFDELSQRLYREVKVLGDIRSPYVVPIVDFLREDSDLFVMIMDLALGITLERMIFDQQRLPVTQALEIAEQILEALGDIHDRGIVHRDLKPENIVVQTLRSGRPYVRLLDFGVAKLKDSPTLTHGFVGTPLFSAPEQIRNAEEVDQRSDLYSLGCILFNALDGVPPFVGERSVDVMQAHLITPPPPLQRQTGDPRLDQALREFVAKALAKTPDTRFASVAEMVSHRVFDLGRAHAIRAPLPARDRTGDWAPPPSAGLAAPGITTTDTARDAPTPSISSTGASAPTATETGTSFPNLLALTAAGDICASVATTGHLVSWDLVARSVLAAADLSGASVPAAMFFTQDDAALCVVMRDGTVLFFEPRTLRSMATQSIGASPVTWAARSLRQPRGALVMTSRELVLVDAVRGEQARIRSGSGDHQIASWAATADGYLVSGVGGANQLRVAETADAKNRLVREFIEVPARLRDAGTVVDISSSGRQLLERNTAFYEHDLRTGDLRVLAHATGIEWRRALWLARDTGIACLSDLGDLYVIRRGEHPILLAQGIQSIAANRDRTRMAGVDSRGSLRTWQPSGPDVQDPGASATTRSQTSSHRTVPPVSSWDVSLQGERVCVALPVGPDMEVAFQREDRKWAVQRLEGVRGVRVAQWSDRGDSVAVLDEGGAVRIVSETDVRAVEIPTGQGEPVRVAVFDGSSGVCVGDVSGMVACVSVARRGGKVTLRWRRPVDREITALRAATIAGRVAVGCRDGTVHVFDLQHGGQTLSLPNTFGPPVDFSFSGDGHMLALLRPMGVVEVYDAYAGRLAFRQQLRQEDVTRIRMEADGALVVAQRVGDAIETYGVETGTLRKKVELRINAGGRA